MVDRYLVCENDAGTDVVRRDDGPYVLFEDYQALALKLPRWRKVADELPKCSTKPDSHGVEVLVWPRGPEVGDYGATAFYGRRVTRSPGFYKYGAVVPGITHWMPLPEPPK